MVPSKAQKTERPPRLWLPSAKRGTMQGCSPAWTRAPGRLSSPKLGQNRPKVGELGQRTCGMVVGIGMRCQAESLPRFWGCFPAPTTMSPNLWTPTGTGCATIQLDSDTNRLETAQGPQDLGIPTSDQPTRDLTFARTVHRTQGHTLFTGSELTLTGQQVSCHMALLPASSPFPLPPPPFSSSLPPAPSSLLLLPPPSPCSLLCRSRAGGRDG